MKTETISYAELAKKVGDAVLFNNATNYDIDDEWHAGLIEGPHVRTLLDKMDEERRAEAQKDIDESKDEGEKAKLIEELEDIEQATMLDLCEDSIYQTYVISPEGARYLYNHTAELISYSEKLDVFLWHITHYGTSWSGVHTEVYDWEAGEETPDFYEWDTSEIIKHTIG